MMFYRVLLVLIGIALIVITGVVYDAHGSWAIVPGIIGITWWITLINAYRNRAI
jgi:hypothetical protein